jgi:PAS domain S-box-containing protein
LTAALEAAIATGQPYILEYRVIRPDQSIRYVIGRGEAIKDQEGRVVKIIGTGLDITSQKQTEIALQRSEARLRLITDSLPGCISYIDNQQRYRFVNQTYETWFDLRREDILGSRVEEVIGPESYARARGHIEAALRGETVTYEMELPYQGNDPRYVSGVLVPDVGDRGTIKGYYALIIDITDRKQLERALQASEQKTQEIFNSALAAIASMRVFENGTWTIDRVSAGCEPLTGFTAEEMTLDNNLWIERILPEDWEAYRGEAFTNIFAEQTGTYEYRFCHKNGSLRWFSQITNSIRDEAQQCWIVTATSVDITDRKLAEDQLMAEFRLRQTIESSIVEGITLISLDGEQTYVNPAFCRMVGWSQQELLGGKPPFVYWPNEEIDRNYQALKNRLSYEGPVKGIELRFKRRSGEPLDVLLLDAPLRDAQGNITARLASIYDITERKVAEALLQEQENLLRAIGDNLPKGFVYQFMHEPGKGFYFNYVSAGVERIVGLRPEQVIGNFNALGDLILEEDRPLVEQANRESLENLSLFEVDMRKRTLWGEIQWSTVRSVPHRLEDGRTVWYGIELDITNLKQTEAALRENEELFRRAFDDAPIGMALVSIEGQFLRVNQALSQIYGYSTAELIFMAVEDVSDPEDMVKDQTLANRVLAGEISTYQLEKRYIHKQGHRVYGLLNVSLLRDDQQRPLYFVTQVQDISERHKIDQMKRDFVSIVSHELRTPLTAMRGALGLLETGVLKNRPDKVQHMMSVALQNSDRLIRLVNSILDLERLESGKIAFVKEPHHLGELMQSAVESLEAIALNSQVCIEVTPLDLVVPLVPDAILQTLTNLLGNAIKFSEAGDTVWLKAEVRPGEARQGNPPGTEDQSSGLLLAPDPESTHVCVSVQDQGKGIPQDKLEAIFDRFQQVDTSDSRQKGGSGLGLSICKKIVERHGGAIWVDSVEGQGSTFYFTLPMDSAQAASVELGE